jgi:hypothetical protein
VCAVPVLFVDRQEFTYGWDVYQVVTPGVAAASN